MKHLKVLGLITALILVLVACGGADAMDPSAISIDTMDLPYSWQANLFEATAYDDSQPPGPVGLPEHMQINFGVTDPADVQFGDPIIYIIPTDEYKQLWDDAGRSTSIRNTHRCQLEMPIASSIVEAPSVTNFPLQNH